ncbi:CorA metal ion transporter [Elasticomyces elasticus]|uniref:CorA metal ion transporter n=1 Tax=Elasticomyces elasticus TaxID=574655 RepID=A0AAN7WHZ9_9PEZI|nr:CorA metal ion transporter [Elasticomyces elasticus]
MDPFNHSRRSWTDDGVHYTMETATYTSPGMSFSATGSSAGGLFDGFAGQSSSRHPLSGMVGAGLLGTAAGLLGAISGLHNASQPRNVYQSRNERRVPFEESDGDSEYEEELAYGDGYASGSERRRRSVLSRFKDRLSDNNRKIPQSQETIPRRSRSRRHPSSNAEPPVQLDEDEDDAYDKRHQQSNFSQIRNDETSRRTVERLREEARRSRKDLERASRQQNVNIGLLQAFLDKVKECEQALATAEEALRTKEIRKEGSRYQAREEHYTRPPPRSRAPPTLPDETDNPFGPAYPLFADSESLHGDPFGNNLFFGAFNGRPFGAYGSSPLLGGDINHLFGMPSGFQRAEPRTKRPRFSSANSGPQPSFAAFMTPSAPRPPATLLQPEEAKRLFKTYNDSWNALSPMDASIPFPARGLKASALLTLDTLWAPTISSPLSTWSEEAIMQANVQAFYLRVADLVPQYTEVGGRVAMGYDKTRASPAQVKQLLDMLKKEKTRWHSDRLGRRNSGRAGPNEALQSDPRARAVFHAVCELMEATQ